MLENISYSGINNYERGWCEGFPWWNCCIGWKNDNVSTVPRSILGGENILVHDQTERSRGLDCYPLKKEWSFLSLRGCNNDLELSDGSGNHWCCHIFKSLLFDLFKKDVSFFREEDRWSTRWRSMIWMRKDWWFVSSMKRWWFLWKSGGNQDLFPT